MTRSAKNWCFTLNNYTAQDVEALAQKASESLESGSIFYLVYGREIGESGTPHLQGFIAFATRKTLAFVRNFTLCKAHCESSKGSPKQASDYCKKDNCYQEFGVCPGGAGKRNDLARIYELIRGGANARTIADQFPSQYIRYRRSILDCIADQACERNWECDVRVLWGRTGTGKTRKVFDSHESKDVYVHPGDSWFNGYEGQEVALFDDFNGSEFKLSYLLKLLDRYKMKVPIKGGYVQWIPKIIYITSNKDPADWYRNALEEHRDAMFRRIKTIEYFP